MKEPKLEDLWITLYEYRAYQMLNYDTLRESTHNCKQDH